MTTRKGRPAFAVIFAMLLAATMVVLALQEPAWAESDQGELTPKAEALQDQDSSEDDGAYAVHKDLKTFMKNYELTAAQKQYTITECERVISKIIKPGMSDLEKYYTIAVWVNDHVQYDWHFWSGGYNFAYYSHQWDAYGAMKEDEQSVCVGIAIFYANMCHAADLPCRFVRLDPDYLDHTINYIPDINGHAYFADVTENVFLMTEKSGSSFAEKADREFANITQPADNYAFDYIEDGQSKGPALKDDDGVYASYDDWFEEFALHSDTTKKWVQNYEELGSGVNGLHRASYTGADPDRPAYLDDPNNLYNEEYSNFGRTPGIWFLDDFYEDPADIEAKIRGKVLDKQLVNVSGLKKNYDCDSVADLEKAVAEDISVELFPSVNEAGEIVPEPAKLANDVDYALEFERYNDATNVAEFTITGIAPYNGSQTIRVAMNSAYVAKAPVSVKDLVYDGRDQALVQPGKAKVGDMPNRMQYGIGTKTKEPKDYATSIPTAKNAGKYYVWYRAAGDKTHAPSQPERLERPVTIAPCELNINVNEMTVEIGKTATLHPTLDQNVPATYTFESEDPSIATVTSKGVVKGIKEGYVDIAIHADSKNPNYEVDFQSASVEVVKATNPIKLKGKTVKIKAKALKKKAKTVKRVKAFTVKNAKGTLSYKLVTAKKGKKSFKKKFKINAKTGKVTVKKGLKKGTYKVTVKVRAKGTKTYKASPWKKVTFKVKVK